MPEPEPRTTITIDLPIRLVEHLNARAAQRLCSRSALLRQLILDDLAKAGR